MGVALVLLAVFVLKRRTQKKTRARASTAATEAITAIVVVPSPPESSPISQVGSATDGSKASLPQQFRSR